MNTTFRVLFPTRYMLLRWIWSFSLSADSVYFLNSAGTKIKPKCVRHLLEECIIYYFCTVRIWGGLGIGRESSRSTGLMGWNNIGINYGMFRYGILDIFLCWTKVAIHKTIFLFSAHHKVCERHWFVNTSESATWISPTSTGTKI